MRRARQGDSDGDSGQDLGPTQGPPTTPAQPPVLEEALQGSADPIAFGRRKQVLQLLAESPPLHSDTGWQDLRHPLQGGERRRRIGGIQRIRVCRATGRRGTGEPAARHFASGSSCPQLGMGMEGQPGGVPEVVPLGPIAPPEEGCCGLGEKQRGPLKVSVGHKAKWQWGSHRW